MSAVFPVISVGRSGHAACGRCRGRCIPKQLLALTSRTIPCCRTRRCGSSGIAGARSPPLVVCNEAHRFTVAEQLRALDPSTPSGILLEPIGRNTAPAVALAALEGAGGLEADATIVVAPADHVIRDSASRFNRRPGSRWASPTERQARHFRHRRACAGDRLRLHPPRCRVRDRRIRWSAIHREAAARQGRAVRGRRRLLLEQRHVRVQGGALPRGTGRVTRRTFWRPRPRPSPRGEERTWTSCASTGRPSRPVAASPSTMR